MQNLFAEMDTIADALPAGPGFWDECQIEFRRLQKVHSPDLTQEQWLDLHSLWELHFLSKLEIRRATLLAHLAALDEERRALFIKRAFLPPGECGEVNERIKKICDEIAHIVSPAEHKGVSRDG